MQRSTKLPAVLAATALALSACASDGTDSNDDAQVAIGDDDTSDDDSSTPVRSGNQAERLAKVALQQFDDCGGFLDYVHTEGAERVGAYGFDNQRYWFGDDVMVMEEDFAEEEAMESDDAMSDGDIAPALPVSAEPESGSQSADSSDGSNTFSTTNVQVDGVDEPDIVKTDGQRVLVVTGNRLVYVDVDDEGRAGERRGSITLSDETTGSYTYGQELLVSGDRAFVIANVEGAFAMPANDGPVPADDVLVDGDAEIEFVDDPIPVEPLPSQPFPGGFNPGPRTVVIEVDVSNPDDLRIENSLTLDGRYLSARAIGDTARVVVTTPPTDLGFLYPSGPGSEARAAEVNAELVRETIADDWIPTYTLEGVDGTTAQGALVDCAGIHAPGEFAGFDMLSVVTLPMDESLAAPTATTSVMATGDTVYASQDRLYVSTNEWISPTFDEQERGIWEESYQTGVHRFTLPTDAAAEYEASGSVDGHLLNQFSMHDQDGTFFVATTTGTPWSSDTSESQIVSMRPDGDALVQIGQVGGMGQGEQIFSVRYVQDTAYVVTFRQTDPFYVVDLTNPTDMVVQGELKIPGVSTYLHPISDSLVIGVGQEGNEEGVLTGSKVSLFDVSDPSNPTEVDVWTLPDSNSDAEFDHRAFLWWAPTSTAVLPLVSWTDQFAGAIVLNITEEGISEQGRVSHVNDEGDDVGVSDCRVFTDVDFPDESFGDLFAFTQEPGTIFQACGSDDRGGAIGYECEVVPTEASEQWFWLGEDADGAERELADVIDFEGVDRLELCWLTGGFNGYDQRIIRTMVIGDQLWSLSPQQLQAHGLDDLGQTTSVEL